MLQGFTHSSPPSPDTPPLSASQRYILEQAPSTHVSIIVPLAKLLDLNRPDNQHYLLEQTASVLGIPLATFLDLSEQQQQHPLHKKIRLDTDIHMPTSYTSDLPAHDGQEKSPLAGQRSPGVNAGRKPYGLFTEGGGISSGWTGSQLADCFASFSMCSPFDSQPGTFTVLQCLPTGQREMLTVSSAYRPLFTPSSYDYHGRRPPALDTAVASIQPQAQVSLVPTPTTPGPASIFPCDDPSLIAQYLPGYPPLQPTRVMEVQPVTGREEMVYPVTSPVTKLEGNEDSPLGNSGLGIQGQPCLMDSPLQTSIMPGAYAAGGEPSTFDNHGGGFVDISSGFHSMQALDVKTGAEHFGIHEGPAALDFFPQRTTPVKRGPFRDQDQREKTALTRKMGSCIRCRMQRIRVSTRHPVPHLLT